jgi:hypothetical protein
MTVHTSWRTGVRVLLSTLLLAAALPAAPDSPAVPRAGLKATVAELARRYDAVLLLDPEAEELLLSRPPVTGSLETALRALTAGTPELAWRRVYLARGAKRPPVEDLAAAARALARDPAEGGGSRDSLPPFDTLLLEEPASKRAALYRREEARSGPLAADLAARGLDPRPIELLYRATGESDGQSPARRLAALERRLLDTGLRDEHRALAFAQVMRLVQEMPAEARDRFAARTVEASMRAWEATSPEQRRQMMRHSMELMIHFDPSVPPRAPGGAAPSPAASAPRRAAPPSLETVVAHLAKRHGETVLLDPGLLHLPAAAPDPAPTLAAALDGLVASLPDARWRRVYLREEQRKRAGGARERAALAATVRKIERLAVPDLALADGERVTFLLKEQPFRPDEPERSGCDPRPLYLLYGDEQALPGALTPEQVAELQRQQLLLLPRLGTAQLATSMASWIRAYEAADEVTRSRILGLPVMAGMMAGWFPQEAKERRERGGQE